ncbi:MAG: peptidylprolyl isomerase [Bacteroidetes bacterium]|nr:peptidylprolyl isomerase [Bacteroidota bacterium]
MKKLIFGSIAALFLMASSCGDSTRVALIETEYGNMKVELSDLTPQHRDNFVKLVEEGFYDDLLFHRVIDGFMIQGGDPNSKDAGPNVPLGSGGPGYKVPAEIVPELIHVKGALAAARQGDQVNPQKESSGSQFYIVHGQPVQTQMLEQLQRQKGYEYTEEQLAAYANNPGTPFLDQDYTVFGMVIEGMDVIDKIAAVRTAAGNRPVEPVKMKITMIR